MQESSHTTLLPHQDSWREKFNQEKKRLLEVFGDKAVAIEHIGSTSIPGLSAKPIIDIAVLVERADEADGFIGPLGKLGYQFDKPSSSTERHLFRKGDPTEFHLSIAYKDKGGFWERQILFRDYLRKHDDLRNEYARLKNALLENDPTGRELYIAGKSDFVNKVLDLAKKEIIIKNIKSSYNIDIVKLDVLRDGSDNIIWDATTGSGARYAIRGSRRNMGEEIAFEAEWIYVLQNEDVPVAPLVRAKNGDSYTSLDEGQAVTVFKFLPGKHFSVSTDDPPPQKAVEAAAKALAILHTISKKHKVDLPRKRTVFSELERVVDHQNLVLEKTPGGKDFIWEVSEILKWGKSQMYDPVLVHNDYRIGNIMFDESDNLLAILDFDWSCIGPAIKDVAHSLAEWSFPDGAQKHNEQVFSGFLKSYNQASDAPIARDNFLYQWMALSCLSDACTFLIDRLLRGEINPPSYSYMYKKYQYFLLMK